MKYGPKAGNTGGPNIWWAGSKYILLFLLHTCSNVFALGLVAQHICITCTLHSSCGWNALDGATNTSLTKQKATRLLMPLHEPFHLEASFIFRWYRAGHQVMDPEIEHFAALRIIHLFANLLHLSLHGSIGFCPTSKSNMSYRLQNRLQERSLHSAKNLFVYLRVCFGM